jgi:hypothetical protein
MVTNMDARKRIASLVKELDVLRRRHTDHERSVAELTRLGSAQAPLIAASRDKVAKKIAGVEKRIAALQEEPDEREVDIDDMIEECSVVGPDVLAFREIQEHAEACDKHAAALAKHVKALHQAITAQRMAHGGRGPSAGIVTSALERAFARHVVGTPLRSLRGPAPLPHHTGFASQIAIWEGMLMPPTHAPPPPPPPISPEIAA